MYAAWPDATASDGEVEPWSVAEYLSRTLRAPGSSARDLADVVVAEAVRVVEAARDAGIIVAQPEAGLEIVATSGAVPQELDSLQHAQGSGPCLTAARKQIVVRVHDVATETRWPGFHEAAVHAGVASMLCLPLHVDDRTMGTLSLYSEQPGAFRDGDAEPAARLLAAVAAVALAEARRTANLARALESRDLIGQAKGILMRGQGVTADEAFQLLTERSQTTNTKLVVVAAQVVESGQLD